MAADLKLQGSTSTPQAHTNSHNNRKTDMNQQLGNTGKWALGIDRRREKKALQVENKADEMQKCTKKFGEAAVWPETREKYIKYIMLSLLLGEVLK